MLGISILGASRRALRAGLLAAAASLAGCGQPGPLYLPAAPAASAVAPAASAAASAARPPGRPASAPGGA